MIFVDGDHPRTAGITCAPEHALTIEIHRHMALRVDCDHAAFAAKTLEFALYDFGRRVANGHLAVFDERADIMRDDRADEIFAVPGRGYRARGIIGISASADD